GDVREVHHVALLIGYGAAAVNPYLALESAEDLARDGHYVTAEPEVAVRNLARALGKGVLKVMSKMGVSTVASYTGAQTFGGVVDSGILRGVDFRGRRPSPERGRPVLHRSHLNAGRCRVRRDCGGGRPPAADGVPAPGDRARTPPARGRRRVPVAPGGRAAP